MSINTFDIPVEHIGSCKAINEFTIDDIYEAAKLSVESFEEEKTKQDTEIPQAPKDPRWDDNGQFRICGTFSDCEDTIRALLHNGYSVTVKEISNRTGYNTEGCTMLIAFRFA